jgi:hypothetical protein
VNITVQHLLEAQEWARAPKTPPPSNVIQLFEQPTIEVDVDMDITEVIPPARLAVLRMRSRGGTY